MKRPLADTDYLRLMIEFASSDPTAVARARWARKLFQAITAGIYAGAMMWPKGKLALQDVRQLRDETAKLLAQIVDGREGVQPRRHSVRISMACDAEPFYSKGRTLFMVYGSPQDTFRYLLVRLLERVAVDRLRRCPNSACGRFFVKRGRREYCSTRCQSAVYMRTYRS